MQSKEQGFQAYDVLGGTAIRFYPPHEDIKKTCQQYETPSFIFCRPTTETTTTTTCTTDTAYSSTSSAEQVTVSPSHPVPIFSINKSGNKLEHYQARIEVTPTTTHFYGGGEQASGLSLRGRQFLTWNTDVFHYNTRSTHLYQSVPYVMALRADGSAFGVIADSTFPLLFTLNDDSLLIESKSVDPVPFSLIIFERETPQEVVSTLAELTGYMALPPKWSLGYHQCRWSYFPDQMALDVARTFRQKNIPCDVIWFDIHYMDEYRIFTFDKNLFPNPNKLNDELHQMGFHTVWMIDPGIKKDDHNPSYSVYHEAMKFDLCVKGEDNNVFVGNVWPGPSVFPDFILPAASTWWSNLYPTFMAHGIDGVWNDMNEPSVFNTINNTIPLNSRHRLGGRGDVVEGTHERFHNVYGMCMAEASFQGILKANPHKRPFLLSRSNFLGGHKYAATWTGDNASDWEHLALSIPMILNLGLSCQPFSGPDIGGFFGEADAELFSRWIGFGALLPFSRGHTHHGTKPHEPYAFGEKTEKTSRTALNRRYKLLLFYYTLFRRASLTGLPVVCPLFFIDPKDQALRAEDRAFMIGEQVLVIANVEPEHYGNPVAVPKNVLWYDFNIDDCEACDPDLPVLMLRGGSIVPVIPVQQYATQKPTTEVTLFIALDEQGKAHGELYDDQGDGYGYKSGQFIELHFDMISLSDSQLQFSCTIQGKEFPNASPELHLQLRVLNKNKNDKMKTTSITIVPLRMTKFTTIF